MVVPKDRITAFHRTHLFLVSSTNLVLSSLNRCLRFFLYLQPSSGTEPHVNYVVSKKLPCYVFVIVISKCTEESSCPTNSRAASASSSTDSECIFPRRYARPHYAPDETCTTFSSTMPRVRRQPHPAVVAGSWPQHSAANEPLHVREDDADDHETRGRWTSCCCCCRRCETGGRAEHLGSMPLQWLCCCWPLISGIHRHAQSRP
jgi:hypothetical protein